MPNPPTAKPRARAASSDTSRPLYTIAVIAALIALIVGVSAGVSMLQTPHALSRSGPAPQWVTPDEVRATTRDGMIVKVRVALGAPDASARSAVERRMQQIGMVLELSVGALSRGELIGANGIARLATEMRNRVNTYLQSEGIDPLRSVVIQDLWYTQR
jgi:flagellar basal body-associated protein FliL